MAAFAHVARAVGGITPPPYASAVYTPAGGAYVRGSGPGRLSQVGPPGKESRMKFRAPRAMRRVRIGLAMAAAVALGSLGLAAAQAGPASAATGCSVTYSVTSQWNTGFTAS